MRFSILACECGVAILCVAVALGRAAEGPSAASVCLLEDAEIGQPPSGFPEAVTAGGGLGKRSVIGVAKAPSGEQVVAQLSPDAKPQPSGAPTADAVDRSRYVGVKKCAECHVGHFDGWKNTGHNKMVRRPVVGGPDATVLADFSVPSEHRKFEFQDVRWVIGGRWKQRFVGEVDGEEVVFPAQWSVRDKKWMSYTAKSDWWWPQHQDWRNRSNFKLCAGCHSTGLDVITETWVELNIACESCHGPGEEHSATPKIENIINPARLSTERSVDICLSCHQAGKPKDLNYAWAVGYRPGMELAKFWNGQKPKPGQEDAEFWHNGTAHKNRVQGNTFLRSVMYDHGIQCTNCHSMHSAQQVSMNVKDAASNALCLTCHGPDKDHGPQEASLTAHTHHQPLSTGSRCIECHMTPTGSNAVPREARDHTFAFISPNDTIQFGVPNSCNTCHTDETPQWALEFVGKWWLKKERDGSVPP